MWTSRGHGRCTPAKLVQTLNEPSWRCRTNMTTAQGSEALRTIEHDEGRSAATVIAVDNYGLRDICQLPAFRGMRCRYVLYRAQFLPGPSQWLKQTRATIEEVFFGWNRFLNDGPPKPIIVWFSFLSWIFFILHLSQEIVRRRAQIVYPQIWFWVGDRAPQVTTPGKSMVRHYNTVAYVSVRSYAQRLFAARTIVRTSAQCVSVIWFPVEYGVLLNEGTNVCLLLYSCINTLTARWAESPGFVRWGSGQIPPKDL